MGARTAIPLQTGTFAEVGPHSNKTTGSISELTYILYVSDFKIADLGNKGLVAKIRREFFEG